MLECVAVALHVIRQGWHPGRRLRQTRPTLPDGDAGLVLSHDAGCSACLLVKLSS